MLKRCTKCGEDKTVDSFHAHPASKDGRAPRCKSCVSAYQQELRLRRKNSPRPDIRDVKKICATCKRSLPGSLFNFKSDSASGLDFECKECHSVRARVYREGNKEAIKARDKSWRDRQDKHELVAKASAWYQNNKARHREVAKKYALEHREELLATRRENWRWKASVLDDAYVRLLLARGEMPERIIPQSLVEAKRVQLQIERLLKRKEKTRWKALLT